MVRMFETSFFFPYDLHTHTHTPLGTDGEHPRYTTVKGCTVREVGLYEKQSSFFVQAKTAQTHIAGNVFFNGPRAGMCLSLSLSFFLSTYIPK